MTNDTVFYTRTMAKVYTGQGNLKKAEEIYMYLLKKDPADTDIIEALSEIEKKKSANRSEPPQRLVLLFEKWINLTLKYNKLKMLNKLKKRC